MYLTSTFTPNNFDSHAGWPVLLSARATDDCGDPVRGAAVSATFSTGDLPVALADNGDGNYSTTWVPSRVQAQVQVAFTAMHRVLGSAGTDVGDGVDMSLHGKVAANPYPIRAVQRFGVANAMFPLLAGPLAPGTVATVFGTNLTDQVVSASSLPLPTELHGARVKVGDIWAPLFFVSPGQINFQIPTELVPGRQYPIAVFNGAAVTVPEIVSIVAAQPAVASFGSGTTIAVHADGTLVSASNPARGGEYLVIYLVGMGATNPGVQTGLAAPANPLANTGAQPTVSVGKSNAAVAFSGLTPGGVGLYQINFEVPKGLNAGLADLIVTQGSASSNVSQLLIGQ